MSYRPHTLVFICLLLWSGLAHAQVERVSPGANAETDVDVRRITPEDLPAPEESTFPSVLRQTDALPRPSSLSELKKGASAVSSKVVEVVVVEIPKPPLRPTPMLTRGHGVWASAEKDGGRPVLVTPHHWLDTADSIWVAPPREKEEGDLPRAGRATLDQISDTRSAEHFVKRAKREGWVEAKIVEVDKHRNLAALGAASGSRLEAPESGLKLFDIDSRPTSRVYGYSPTIGGALVATRYIEPTDEAELSFYLQTSFAAILGAPIVTGDGELVGVTVFRHPEDPARTLVVPPASLGRFVRSAQGLDDTGGPTETDVKEQ